MSENIFEKRRSIKFFDKNKSLSEELLKKIIDTAVLAPSSFNLQPWRLIAVETKEAKMRLYNAAMQQDKVLDAPVVLIVVADHEGYAEHNPMWHHIAKTMSEKRLQGAMRATARIYGKDEKTRTMYAQSNTGLLAMSIMYAAAYFGVDSHPMSGMEFDVVKEEFNLMPTEEPVMLICLGYFDQSAELAPRAKRRGYEEIVEKV